MNCPRCRQGMLRYIDRVVVMPPPNPYGPTLPRQVDHYTCTACGYDVHDHGGGMLFASPAQAGRDLSSGISAGRFIGCAVSCIILAILVLSVWGQPFIIQLGVTAAFIAVLAVGRMILLSEHKVRNAAIVLALGALGIVGFLWYQRFQVEQWMQAVHTTSQPAALSPSRSTNASVQTLPTSIQITPPPTDAPAQTLPTSAQMTQLPNKTDIPSYTTLPTQEAIIIDDSDSGFAIEGSASGWRVAPYGYNGSTHWTY